MTNKKYWILMPPFLLIGLLLVIYLPQNLKPLAILTALVFWCVYYIWTYIERNKERRKL